MKQFYYGEKNTGPYFEGWYFKLRAREGRTLALIPAMHLDAAGNRTASLQVVTGERAWYIPFPGDAFDAKEKKQISVTSKGAVVEANTVLLPGDML